MEIWEISFNRPLDINSLGESSACSTLEIEGDNGLLKENLWGFNDLFWPQIKEEFQTVERLYAAIQDIQDEIWRLKEKFRNEQIQFPDLKVEINSNRGVSGSYLLVDEEGNKKYIIKPVDEDAGCINSFWYSTPFMMCPIRENIALYQSSMREALAYEVAKIIGVDSIVPKTTLAVFESAVFHNFIERVAFEERKRLEETLILSDKEKLCSVQEYIPNSKSLFEALHELQSLGLSDQEIALRFCTKDFEEANILLWTTYDTDGHAGNFLVYPKGFDEIGNEILGIKKIDNGLAFPEKNGQFRNFLPYLPNGNNRLSEEGIAKILAIDVEKLASQFEKKGLASAIPALKERISFLKEQVTKDNMTILEINIILSKIGKKT